MKIKFRRSLLAAALSLASASAFAQSNESPFSQTWFFGDSLTDAGFYEPFLVQTQGPDAAIVGQFTTNPGFVWAQFLADHYGTDGSAAWGLTVTGVTPASGTNFAAGGATFNNGPGYPPTPPTQFAPTIPAQVAAYLSRSGGKADPGALYTVWGGANDLFFHLNGLSTQQAFLGAAGIQVGVVKGLADAGARYILVPTMPDVGQTPFGLSQGPAGSAGITALVQAYNQLLFGGLQQANANVIPLNTFDFIREISASPATYGFANTTGQACVGVPSSLVCAPPNFATPNAAETYAFADSVHPTTGAHRLLAQYTVSVIDGPRLAAILPHSATTIGSSRVRETSVAIAGFDGEGMRWWADVRGDNQRYNDTLGFDGLGVSGSFGIGKRSGNLVYGGFAGYGRQPIDFGLRRGSFDQTDATLGGFVGWNGDGPWANAQVSYTWLDFDIDREVHLGPGTRIHSGSTDGSNLTAALEMGWSFGHDALRHGPVLSLVSQRIDVDGYAESEPSQSTSLAYPDQKYDSLVGSIGWQASYAINDHLAPFARVTYNHEFEDEPAQVFAQMQSMPGTQPFAVPGLAFDKSHATLSYGVRSTLMGLEVVTGSSLGLGQAGGGDHSFFLSVGGKF